MSIYGKVLAAAAGLTLLGGIAAAGTARASSPDCAFSNGCATLHGTDANGNTVAMDAKKQNKAGIVIGYPDNAGDGATSFDGVLHYGKGVKTTSYTDTGLQANNWDRPAASSPRLRRRPPARSPLDTDELTVNNASTTSSETRPGQASGTQELSRPAP